KFEGVVEDLEKTMSFVSPVKSSLGASSIDPTLSDDKRADLFFHELARLERENEVNECAAQARVCALRPLGEVFEDHYRETYGLPPRRSADNRGSSSSDEGCASSEGHGPNQTASLTVDSEGGDLASDPEIAWLLSVLQAEAGDEKEDEKDYKIALQESEAI
ncbi:unnamed protein product, partial [Discosporangium mesarthrocarpum]